MFVNAAISPSPPNSDSGSPQSTQRSPVFFVMLSILILLSICLILLVLFRKHMKRFELSNILHKTTEKPGNIYISKSSANEVKLQLIRSFEFGNF